MEEPSNVKLANGFVTSGANLGTVKALVDHQDLDSLVGRMMQHIEATYTDNEQREAQKAILKNMCRDWLTHIYEWQKGWEIAFDVNPEEQGSDKNPPKGWTSHYKNNG